MAMVGTRVALRRQQRAPVRKNIRRGNRPRPGAGRTPEAGPGAKPVAKKSQAQQLSAARKLFRRQPRKGKVGRITRNRRIVAGEAAPEVEVASGLRARFDRLGPGTKRLLRAGSRIGGIVALAYALLLGAEYGHDYATTSPRFAVKDVVFETTPHVPSEHLVATMAIVPGTNLLSVDLEKLREQIVADPWVADATVERDLPDTLRVEVVEHEALAVLLAGEFFLVNSQGVPFKRLERGERQDLPVITGVERAELEAGADAKARKTIGRALEVLTAYNAGETQRPALAEVHVAADGAISLYTAGQGTQIRLGRGPVEDKFARLDALHAGLGERAQTLAVVHLDQSAGPGRKDRVAASFLSHEDERAVLERGRGSGPNRAAKPEQSGDAPMVAPKPAVITAAGFKTVKKSPKHRIPRYE